MKENHLATNLVNLDALILREDLAVTSEPHRGSPKTTGIRITDLEPNSFFYRSLRKPDFQRETSNWSPQKIAELVKTFLNQELVPAIILWEAGSNVFVIDGAHRLSALISWVHNDYGDGTLSRRFFENHIPPEQAKAAQRTRDLIHKAVGSYADHQIAMSHPDKSPPAVLSRALKLGTLALELQWVQAPDADKAAASFFKINQEATPIDKTELLILKSRRTANAISARAIVRNGTGHQYWSHFGEEEKAQIRTDAQEIHSLLFSPQLDVPIKTLDLPFAGRGYGSNALPLIFDLVGIAAGSEFDKSRKIRADEEYPADTDGSQTLLALKKTKRLVQRITGTTPGSLGLHPALYVYGRSGNHQPSAFLGLITFVQSLENRGRLGKFSKHRGSFEDFLLENRGIISAIVHKLGSGPRSVPKVSELYDDILERIEKGVSTDQVMASLQEKTQYQFLSLLTAGLSEESSDNGFSRNAKSAVFLKEALGTPNRCAICNGLMHKNSMTVDHVVRKQDGGDGSVANGQMAHPYCNSTLKN